MTKKQNLIVTLFPYKEQIKYLLRNKNTPI